jgi:hypothetical protein
MSYGQVRLLGITGLQGSDDQVAFPDNTLFEISMADAESTKIAQLTWIPDTHAIGFNPDDGLLYHTAGSEAWTNDPFRDEGNGFRDHQYMETYNLATQEFNAIFNGNPAPSPDDLAPFGLPAPRPTWVLPEAQRLIEDTGDEWREKGENEYHALRHLAWSEEEKLFYASDEDGIYKMTPAGESTYIGPERNLGIASDYKALAFYKNPAGDTVLLAGNRRNDELYTLDLTTGEPVDDPVNLQIPPDSPYDLSFDGLLGMAQHPENGTLYGIRNAGGESEAFDRELIVIDPATGETNLIGTLGLHFTSLTFASSPGVTGDFNKNGVLDGPDINDLTARSAGATNPIEYDLNADLLVNEADVTVWVKDLFNSWIGDANLDGVFNSSDLIDVLASGTYEADVAAVWTTGDFNGDGRTNSTDLIAALADGGYEVGPRAALAAVPEPSAVLLLSVGLLALARQRKR